MDLLKIEEIEKDILLELGLTFRNSLEDFNTSLDRSLKYLDKIVLSTIMASTGRSYNPFSEIIEKYVFYILVNKLEKFNYKLTPLSYSSDLTFEKDGYIINIDVKTANLDNPSDFKETINLGINQITHIAKLPYEGEYLSSPFYVYPTIPPFYKFENGEEKLNLTYGLLFIYPPYKDIIEWVYEEYKHLFELFKDKIIEILRFKINTISEKKSDLITENIIRGIFIHNEKEIFDVLNLNDDELDMIYKFKDLLKEFTKKLRDRNVKPIAIIAISIPNGLLKSKYVCKFVSGKSYGKSARYHYEDGFFEILKENNDQKYPRVIFLDINKKYQRDLEKYFKNIFVLDINIKRL